MIARPIKFGLVGVGNTAFGLTVIYLCKAAGMADVPANVAGYACGLILSFQLNKAWTFGASSVLFLYFAVRRLQRGRSAFRCALQRGNGFRGLIQYRFYLCFDRVAGQGIDRQIELLGFGEKVRVPHHRRQRLALDRENLR